PDRESSGTPTRGPQRIDHSTAGARFAEAVLKDHHGQPHPLGKLLAYAIAGHHGRLPDWASHGSNASLTHRLDPTAYAIPTDLLRQALLRNPGRLDELLPP